MNQIQTTQVKRAVKAFDRGIINAKQLYTSCMEAVLQEKDIRDVRPGEWLHWATFALNMTSKQGDDFMNQRRAYLHLVRIERVKKVSRFVWRMTWNFHHAASLARELCFTTKREAYVNRLALVIDRMRDDAFTSQRVSE